MAASRWKSKLALKRQPMKSTGECSRTQRSSQHNGQNNSSNETSTTGSKQMFTVFWIAWIAWVAWIMTKINWFNSTSISILYSSLIKTHCRINFARYINSTNTFKWSLLSSNISQLTAKKSTAHVGRRTKLLDCFTAWNWRTDWLFGVLSWLL